MSTKGRISKKVKIIIETGMKECPRCKSTQTLKNFHRDSSKTHKTSSYCIKCSTEKAKESLLLLREKVPPKIVKGRKLTSKESYHRHLESIKSKGKEYLKEHKLKVAKYQKEYRKKNVERIRLVKRTYKTDKLKNDILFKLKDRLCERVRKALKYNIKKGIIKYKTKSTQELLGVTIDIVKKHLESKFSKGMTWNNYGKWHIDHIIPLGSAKTEEELYILCHYTNLQPLWARDNCIKNDSIPSVQMKLTI